MGRKSKVNEQELIEMLGRDVRIPDIATHFNCSISAVKRAMKKLNDRLPMLRETMTPSVFRAKEQDILTQTRAELAAILRESLRQHVGIRMTTNDIKKLGDLAYKLWQMDRVMNDKSTENVAVAKKIYHELDEDTKKYIDKLETTIYEGEKKNADKRYEREKQKGDMF